jgi:SAM-dependent methyltransferase
VTADFDRLASSYREVINKHAAITGESFEYFIELRLALVQEELARGGRPAPSAILDFGCGIGATAAAMRARFPGATIDGVDSSPESVRVAGALGLPGGRFHVSAGGTLPFADGAFDLVYSNGTFHHIPHRDHPAIFREIARVLRPGGSAFVFENNPFNPLVVYEMKRAEIDRGTRMVFPRRLARLERGAGLRVQRARYYVFFPKQLKGLRWTERYLRRVPLGAQYYVWGVKE